MAPQQFIVAREHVLGGQCQPGKQFIYSYSSLPKYVFIQSCFNEQCRKKNTIETLSVPYLYKYSLACHQVRVTFKGR